MYGHMNVKVPSLSMHTFLDFTHTYTYTHTHNVNGIISYKITNTATIHVVFQEMFKIGKNKTIFKMYGTYYTLQYNTRPTLYIAI
jgi:hypothetical protein